MFHPSVSLMLAVLGRKARVWHLFLKKHVVFLGAHDFSLALVGLLLWVYPIETFLAFPMRY